MYLNIMVTLILIHSILYLVFYKNKGYTIISCGLFAFISDRATGAQKFSWDKFNHLGLDNDERGGDSVGRAVGENISKFVNNKKAKTTYQEYVINHKNGEPYHIALGHTRKASVGLITEANAQPIVIDLPEGGKFIMVHNGTIYNWEDLAKKHNISSVGKTDSMVLAEIICSQGFDVLKEYNGAAAIIIRDDREPDTLKVFKGASQNYQKKVEEERPLYYYQESENSMYISSKEDGLFFIGGTPDDVIDFDTNTLYTILEGQIVNSEKIDRSSCSSVKIWTNNNDFYGTKRIYREEDYYPSEREDHRPNIRKDIIPHSNTCDKVLPARLRYYFKKSTNEAYFVNGIFKLTEEGKVWTANSKEKYKEYYFYAGIMLKDAASYYAVKEKFGKARQFDDCGNNIKQICKYAVYPVCTLESDTPHYQNATAMRETEIWATKQKTYEPVLFTGTVSPIFSYKEYKFRGGDLESVTYSKDIKKADHSTDLQVVKNETATQGKLPIDISNSACSMVTRALAEKAVGAMVGPKINVKGFLPATITPKSNLSVRDFSINPEDIEEDFDEKFTMGYSGGGYEDLYEKIDDDEIEDYDDDANFDALIEGSETVNKVLSQGIDNILKAVDDTIQELEVLGIKNKQLTTALSNLYKMQDPFLDVKEFKNKPLILSYEQF